MNPGSNTLLSVSSAHVAYGKVEAVRSVSLEVAGNEIVTIVGANGAGKTTLLNAIMGILPVRGRVTLPAKTSRSSRSRTASRRASAWCRNIASCSPP